MSSTRRPFTAEMRRSGTPPPPTSKKKRASAGTTGTTGPGDDTSAILAAIADVSDRLARVEAHLEDAEPPKPEPEEIPEDLRRQVEEARFLRTEIAALARSIEDTKVEIAKLRDQRPEGDRLTDMAHELDAIVDATESATNGILDIAETVTTLTAEIQAHNSDGYVRQLADDIQENLLNIFEHCNFQDLTGQRISKVVNAMKFIEDRLDRMMDIWGHDGFLEYAPAKSKAQDDRSLEDRDRDLLNGPQTKEQGISQNEIDALFD